ncbi:MAG: hypothetical protein ACLR23_01965 [Clostridia bacterium]
MRAGIYRSVSMLLTAVFLLSSLITGTLGWQSLGQTAKNEAQSEVLRHADVELLKLEKLPDGTETENLRPRRGVLPVCQGRAADRRAVCYR